MDDAQRLMLADLKSARVSTGEFNNALALYLGIENEAVEIGAKGSPRHDAFREYMHEARRTLVERFSAGEAETLVMVYGACPTVDIFWPHLEAVIIDGDDGVLPGKDRLLDLFNAHMVNDDCIVCRDRRDQARIFSSNLRTIAATIARRRQ